MKTFFAALFALSLCILPTACSSSSPAPEDAEDEKPNYEELETQLEAVASERDALQVQLDMIRAEQEAEEQAATVQEGDVTVLVTDKTVTPKNTSQWIFSNYVNFVFSITNNTEKEIQGIQGKLEIDDLFGTEIMTIGCDFTGETIAPGATITNDSLSFECNDFASEDMKLFNEDYRDLKFNYIPTQIVFTDGTVKTIAS